MKKINSRVLVIPPYISTNWSQVQALYVKDGILQISLINNEKVAIASLSQEDMEKIFASHAEHMSLEQNSESHTINPFTSQPELGLQRQDNPFRISIGRLGGFEQLGNLMQHNPEQSNIPTLPSEMLKKISSIAKIVSSDELENLPKAEPHCNCIHCQLLRAMSDEEMAEEISEIEEEVSEDDLRFNQWDITIQSDKVFSVINPLDRGEEYKVCLDPVGCTCGQEGCEHIIAVLKS